MPRKLIAAAAALAALVGFTPIRPASRLGEQDPARIVAAAPANSTVSLPARYAKGREAEIVGLASLTNALALGQILLQRRMAEVAAERDALAAEFAVATNRAARLDALAAWAAARRDAAALPTTKALWQSVIDRIEEGAQ